MMRLVFSEMALADLDGILHYIARDKPTAAVHFVDALEQQCQQLREAPHAGERREELAPQLRVLAFRGYGIYFRVVESGLVRIERVLHGGMDVRSGDFT